MATSAEEEGDVEASRAVHSDTGDVSSVGELRGLPFPTGKFDEVVDWVNNSLLSNAHWVVKSEVGVSL